MLESAGGRVGSGDSVHRGELSGAEGAAQAHYRARWSAGMLATTRAGDSEEAGQWWHRQWAAQARGDGAGEKRRAREGALGSGAAREKVLKELNENGGGGGGGGGRLFINLFGS